MNNEIKGRYFTSMKQYPCENNDYVNQMNVYDRSEYERKYFNEIN